MREAGFSHSGQAAGRLAGILLVSGVLFVSALPPHADLPTANGSPIIPAGELPPAASSALETERVTDNSPSAARGYEVLRRTPFLPPDFDQATFETLWTVWTAEERDAASQATPAERRRRTLARYGLHEPPEAAPGHTGPDIGHVEVPLGEGATGWVMNCFACHAGRVAGRTLPGAPNVSLDLQTLIEDVRRAKLARWQPPGHLELASLKIPLGGPRGTTNAVMFGVILAGLRNPDMTVDLSRVPGPLVHHPMDAPPLWHLRHKPRLYIDGFSPKNHRVLMQFLLLPANDRDTVLSWERDFRDVLAYLESLEAPRYPGPIDPLLAKQGRTVYSAHCAQCHGDETRYPFLTVPIEEIGTDRVRLDALTVPHREHLQASWLTAHGRDETITDPAGYVAPPLTGLWATAPYFHNGSVPTLWHLLRPEQRPTLWRRLTTHPPDADGFDDHRIGLLVEEIPPGRPLPNDPVARRQRYDTRLPGQSAAGHDYPAALSEPEKQALLEYLKTL